MSGVGIVVRYHVPRSQVWEGSRGGQSGKNHLHVTEEFRSGRLHRHPGPKALCGRDAWYSADERDRAERCPRCEDMAKRHGIEWPQPPASTEGEQDG